MREPHKIKAFSLSITVLIFLFFVMFLILFAFEHFTKTLKPIVKKSLFLFHILSTKPTARATANYTFLIVLGQANLYAVHRAFFQVSRINIHYLKNKEV